MVQINSGLAPVQDNQNSWEILQLVEVYKAAQPEFVVEIGTYKGGTLWHWLQHACPGSTVVSIDKGPSFWRPAEPKWYTSIWQGWVPEGVMFAELRGDSASRGMRKLVQLHMHTIDRLFIDGDHS